MGPAHDAVPRPWRTLIPVPTPQTVSAEESILAAPPGSRSYPRWLGPTLIYGVLTVLCALAAYWLMFSQYAAYDDEGFFDYSVKLFAAGHPLYNSVWTTYGPFYYLVFGGFLAAVGHGITTDAGRLIQVTIWVATSLGLGVTTHRLTGRLTLGVAALATSFVLLTGLTPEPMLPGALICVLLTALVAVVAFVLPARPRVALAAIGALAATLLLTKVNVGAYAIVSIGFATVMTRRSLAGHALVRWLAVAAFVLVGPAVMTSNLNSDWARSYALLAVLSTLALVFVALPRALDDDAPEDWVAWPSWLIGGFGVCVVIVLTVLFALGTTPGALVHMVIVVPTRQASFLTIPAPLDGDVIWWSLMAAALAWTWRQAGPSSGFASIASKGLWGGLLRTIAGVAILLSLASESVFSVAPNAPFSLAMPLAWIAALPSIRDTGAPRERLGRLLVPSVAILYCLLAYPVAGTQLRLGAILLVPCGAMCIADGWAELEAWDNAGSRIPASLLPALGLALAVGTTFLYIVQPVADNHDQYREGTALTVSGATRLHLSPAQGVPIDQAVKLVRARCRTLMTLPAMSSFNIWTGLPTPSPTIGAQPYWRELTYGQQVTLLHAATQSDRLCVVRNDGVAATYGGAPLSSPIVNYLDRDFRPIGQFPPYTVEVRR